MDKEQLKRLHRVHRPENFRPRASTWYEIRNISTDVAVVNLYDEIGLWGVTASSFIDDLHAVNAKTIELHISSPGGDVFDGLAILNSLRSHPANVNVVVDGIAASAASFIAMAGDTISMSPQAMLMIHDASGVSFGNAEDMLEMAALLDKASNNIAAVYQQRAGGTVDSWRAAMKAETWYTDQEAVDAGLADGILGEAPPQKEEPKETEEPEEDGACGGEHEMPPGEEKTGTKKPVPAAETDPTLIEAGDSDPSVVMPTTSSFASWDLSSIRDALTAAKEATTHG